MSLIPDDIRRTWGIFKFYSVAIIVLMLVAYFAFMHGNQYFEAQKAQIETLQQTVENLKIENEKLTRNFNILSVELEVQRLADQKSQTVIEEGLNREAQLKQEVLFYQKVMAPELKQDGFTIEAFSVEKSLSESSYRFELVLMQQDKIKNVIKGSVDVDIKGSLNGKPVSLKLSKLMQEQDDPLHFSFKYFQILDGQITLPNGFKPEKVTVNAEVYQFKKKRGELQRTFDWVLELQESVEVPSE